MLYTGKYYFILVITMQSVITTVTQKGQVSIPKHIRQALGMGVYSKVYVKRVKGYIKIEATKDILDMAGKIKPNINQSKSVLEARSAMERDYR